MKSTVSMLVFVLGGILISTFLAHTPALARLAPYDGIGGSGGAPFPSLSTVVNMASSSVLMDNQVRSWIKSRDFA